MIGSASKASSATRKRRLLSLLCALVLEVIGALVSREPCIVGSYSSLHRLTALLSHFLRFIKEHALANELANLLPTIQERDKSQQLLCCSIGPLATGDIGESWQMNRCAQEGIRE